MPTPAQMTIDQQAPDLPPTPDFDSYAIPADIVEVGREADGRILRVAWSDGRASRFHAVWLRDNASDPQNLNLETREQNSDVTALPADPAIADARVDGAGALVIRWRPCGTVSRFHPGWLYAHDYGNGGRPNDAEIALVVWDAASLPEPPSFDGAAILEDDALLEAWLQALAAHGIARLRGLPSEPGLVARVGERLGPVRATNFGRVFDVRVKPDPDSNAYTAMALTPHTDLPTREYQPGLQMLHCLQISGSGGRAVMVDGYRIAAHIRQEDPAAFSALTETPWNCSNRARDTDYRWRAPVIALDDSGGIREVRATPFLRAPLEIDFDRVPEAYRALRVFFTAVADPAFRMRFDYRPGDLVAMDNRRVLHGREAYDPASGERWLQGCYVEREELLSRLRILARRRRAAAAARP